MTAVVGHDRPSMTATGRPAPAWRGDVLAVVVFLAVLVVTCASIAGENGAFTYSLDDAYIHLAMAETLAEHGTWGIEPGVFESASSAPAWTAALAASTALPVDNAWLPLLLNAFGGVLLLLALIRASGANDVVGRAVVGIVAVFALALVPSSILGMETLLHAAAVAWFVLLVTDVAAGRRTPPWWVSAAVGALLVTLRLESAFLVAGAGLGLLLLGRGSWRERLRMPAALAGGAAAALGAIAALNLAFGQFPLPTPVVAKSRVLEDGDSALLRPLRDPGGAIEILGRNVSSNPRLLWAVAACLVVVALPLDRLRAVRVAAVTVLVAFVGQSWYGYTFNRYGEYLVAGGAVVAGLAVARLLTGRDEVAAGPRWLPWVAAVGVLALGQLPVLGQIADAPSSVHRQQEQMARFIEQHYEGRAVALNDLGFIAWRHDGPILDLLGLGTAEMTELRRASAPEDLVPDQLEAEAAERGVEVVVVYPDRDKFFPNGLPASWEPVEEWCLVGSIGVAGGRCVTWFATADGDAAELATALDEYRPRLPAGVRAEPAARR
jgi:hypothetical protein